MEVIASYERYQVEVRRRQARTIEKYVPEIRDFLRHLGCGDPSGRELAEVLGSTKKPQVVEFLRRATPTGKSPGPVTWNSRLAAVRSLFDYVNRIEDLTMNAAQQIDRQRVFDKETVPLTLDEMVRLVDALRRHSPTPYAERNVALAQVLIHTALRVSEVVSVDIDRVDFEHSLLLNVRRKGGKSLASSMNDVLAEALGACMSARRRFNPRVTEPALFLSDRGTRLSVRAVQEIVASHGKLAGISTPVTPHLLRHSSATQLAALGTPLRVVQDICGHASISTTQRYVHTGVSDRQRAVDALATTWKAQVGRAGILGTSDVTSQNPN